MAKLIKNVVIVRDCVDQLNGTLRGAIQFLERMAELHGDDAQFEIGRKHNYDDTFVYASISIVRQETDEEEQERINRERLIASRVEQQEKVLWEKLNAKYGKKEE